MHVCIQAGHSACLVILLTHRQSSSSSQSGSVDQVTDHQWLDTVLLQNIANLSDKDGRMLGHLATARDTKVC